MLAAHVFTGSSGEGEDARHFFLHILHRFAFQCRCEHETIVQLSSSVAKGLNRGHSREMHYNPTTFWVLQSIASVRSISEGVA